MKICLSVALHFQNENLKNYSMWHGGTYYVLVAKQKFIQRRRVCFYSAPKSGKLMPHILPVSTGPVFHFIPVPIEFHAQAKHSSKHACAE